MFGTPRNIEGLFHHVLMTHTNTKNPFDELNKTDFLLQALFTAMK